LQRLFQRISIRLVQRKLKIGFFNPLTRGVDAKLRIAVRNLFDSDNDFHNESA